jgi:hypothetical protein
MKRRVAQASANRSALTATLCAVRRVKLVVARCFFSFDSHNCLPTLSAAEGEMRPASTRRITCMARFYRNSEKAQASTKLVSASVELAPPLPLQLEALLR